VTNNEQQPDSLDGLYHTEAARAKAERMLKLLGQIAAASETKGTKGVRRR
jgi:hypothetical protein